MPTLVSFRLSLYRFDKNLSRFYTAAKDAKTNTDMLVRNAKIVGQETFSCIKDASFFLGATRAIATIVLNQLLEILVF